MRVSRWHSVALSLGWVEGRDSSPKPWCVCVSACMHVHGSLEQELQVVVSHLVELPGTEPRSSARAASAVSLWAISSSYSQNLFTTVLIVCNGNGSEDAAQVREQCLGRFSPTIWILEALLCWPLSFSLGMFSDYDTTNMTLKIFSPSWC